jgi:outer membrane lipoprotein-sorting protein
MLRLLFLLVSIPAFVMGQTKDTARILQNLSNDLRKITGAIYEYEMDAAFPNGKHSLLTGSTYLSTTDKIYYNDCNEFTMLYTGRWFYKADHKSRSVAIIDLSKEKNKAAYKLREKQIFSGGAMNAFLDSLVLKRSAVQQFDYNDSGYKIAFSFPPSSTVQTMTIAFDTVKRLPVSCEMSVHRPCEKTEKGMQMMSVDIICKNFKRLNDNEKALLEERNFFTTGKQKRIVLNKYTNYKITSKI